jgi:hypothetical protein
MLNILDKTKVIKMFTGRYYVVYTTLGRSIIGEKEFYERGLPCMFNGSYNKCYKWLIKTTDKFNKSRLASIS